MREGELPDLYKAKSEVCFSIRISRDDLMGTRLAIYEQVQDLHQFQEQPKVLVSRNCPSVIVADLLDLPRLELYVELGFPLSDLPNDERILTRVHVMNRDTFKDKLNVLIAKRDGQSTSQEFTFLFFF